MSETDAPPRRDVELGFFIPEDLELTFADVSFVQDTGSEFVLMFFQTSRPVITSEKDLGKVHKIPAYCVARMVLTPRHMEKFLGIAQEAVNQHKANAAKKEEES